MPSRISVYFLPNGDGVHSFLVAARNQTHACRLLNCSVGHFKSYGGRRVDESLHPDLAAVARSEPGRVWQRELTHRSGDPRPWVYERTSFTDDDRAELAALAAEFGTG